MRFPYFLMAAVAIIAAYCLLPLPGQIGNSLVSIGLFAFIIIGVVVLLSLKFSTTALKAYHIHRALLETEMCLMEMFARLSSGGVDKRRDRMVDIMQAAETCRYQNARILVIGKEKGDTQETARGIIAADQKDLASFRGDRRGARVNAFALEAVLKCRPKAAKNQILTKRLQALQKGATAPEVIPALNHLLGIPLSPTEAQVNKLLESESRVEELPFFIAAAVWFWKHPRELTFTDKDGRVLKGWEALSAMRQV